MERLRRIAALRWDVGVGVPDEVKENLSPQEVFFY
jgi:hypothetical protein